MTMKNVLFALLMSLISVQAHTLNMEERLIKQLINKSVQSNATAAVQLANQTCNVGMSSVSSTILELSQTADINKLIDEGGLLLAVIKYVDGPTFVLIRDSLVRKDATPLNNILKATSAITCDQSITVYEVFQLAIQ